LVATLFVVVDATVGGPNPMKNCARVTAGVAETMANELTVPPDKTVSG
jgi:hypothetical protein